MTAKMLIGSAVILGAAGVAYMFLRNKSNPANAEAPKAPAYAEATQTVRSVLKNMTPEQRQNMSVRLSGGNMAHMLSR